MSLNQKSKVCKKFITALPVRVARFLKVDEGDELEYVERGGKVFIKKYKGGK